MKDLVYIGGDSCGYANDLILILKSVVETLIALGLTKLRMLWSNSQMKFNDFFLKVSQGSEFCKWGSKLF